MNMNSSGESQCYAKEGFHKTRLGGGGGEGRAIHTNPLSLEEIGAEAKAAEDFGVKGKQPRKQKRTRNQTRQRIGKRSHT